MSIQLPVPRFLRDYISAIVAENMTGFSTFVDSAMAALISTASSSGNKAALSVRDQPGGVVGIDAANYIILSGTEILTVNSQKQILVNMNLLPTTDPHVKGVLYQNAGFLMVSNG